MNCKLSIDQNCVFGKASTWNSLLILVAHLTWTWVQPSPHVNTSLVGANSVKGPSSCSMSAISATLRSAVRVEKRRSIASTSNRSPVGGDSNYMEPSSLTWHHLGWISCNSHHYKSVSFKITSSKTKLNQITSLNTNIGQVTPFKTNLI